MSIINTNVSALRAQSAGSMAGKDLSTTMERLSTGRRINSAKDDAAGLAIAQRMTANIKGANVAIRNANDGISMAQTAEGALSEVTNMLQRMRELAVQSSNGTLSDENRGSLQAETNQLLAEMNNVAKTTNFNGLKLLDGSNESVKLQTGINSGDSIDVSFVTVSTNELGLTSGGADGQLVTGRVSTGTVISGDVTFNGANAVASDVTLGADAAKDLAAAINENSAKTGVTATASNNVTSGKITAETFAAGSLEVNDVAIAASGNAQELVANINRADTGVTATLNKDETITLSNSDGSDIKIASSNADDGFTSATNTGFLSLQSEDGKDIKVAAADNDGTPGVGDAEVAKAQLMGLNVSADGVTFSGQDVGANALTAGGLVINGVEVGASADGTAAEKANAINAASSQTGVLAAVNGSKIELTSADGSEVRVEGAEVAEIGFTAQGGTDKFTSTLDVSSAEAAAGALSRIDAALENVAQSRGDLGAVQNRLESTVNNLTNVTTNLSDARSRIEDADFAAETTKLAKSQILQQAAQAMLAQANQSKQGVLSLLR